MRIPVVAMAALLSMAGCLSASDGQTTVGGEDENGVPVTIEAGNDTRTYEFDLTELTYENTLRAFRIVAHADTFVEVAANGATGSSASEDDCFAVAAFSPAGRSLDDAGVAEEDLRTSRGLTANPGGGTGFGHVHFAWRNNGLEPRVEVAGNQVQPDVTDHYGQTSPLHFGKQATWYLPAGESVIVQAGGKSDRYIRGGDAQPNAYGLTISMGASHIETLPDVPIRCGVGVLDLDEEAAHAQMFISGAAVGGHVLMETKNATTFLFVDRLHLADQERSAQLQYPGLPPVDVSGPGAKMVRSSNATGTAGFTIDYWAATLTSIPFWFVADTQWPGVSWADPSSG
jgi:hypothetical protein